MFGTMWPAVAARGDSASYIPRSKYALVHKAALDARDALDGVCDGVIDDPARCHFDPKMIECKGVDGPSCLMSPQVEAARKIYAGPMNPRTGTSKWFLVYKLVILLARTPRIPATELLPSARSAPGGQSGDQSGKPQGSWYPDSLQPGMNPKGRCQTLAASSRRWGHAGSGWGFP